MVESPLCHDWEKERTKKDKKVSVSWCVNIYWVTGWVAFTLKQMLERLDVEVNYGKIEMGCIEG